MLRPLQHGRRPSGADYSRFMEQPAPTMGGSAAAATTAGGGGAPAMRTETPPPLSSAHPQVIEVIYTGLYPAANH